MCNKNCLQSKQKPDDPNRLRRIIEGLFFLAHSANRECHDLMEKYNPMEKRILLAPSTSVRYETLRELRKEYDETELNKGENTFRIIGLEKPKDTKLPIEFATWLNDNYEKKVLYYYRRPSITEDILFKGKTPDLFSYFINNVWELK